MTEISIQQKFDAVVKGARVILEKKEALEKAMAEIKVLRGIIPICMHCKEIRDDQGYWIQLEQYFSEHSDAQFSHCICDKCKEKYYPELKK